MLRKSRNLSQAEVGQLLGVSQKRIAWIESLPGRTSFDQISRLVAALGGRLEVRIISEVEAPNKDTKKSPVAW